MYLLEPDPAFDSYLQGPIPTSSIVDLLVTSNKDVSIANSTNSTGK